MSVLDGVGLAQEALLLATVVSLPVLGALALASLVVSLLQSAFGFTDAAVAHLPRLAVAAGVLTAAGPWMAARIVAFAGHVFALGS